MNANLLNVVKEIVTQCGEQVLSEPKRVSAFFADLAKDEPKPQKNALVKCLEHGFIQILKNAAEPDRVLCKQQLAQKLHEEEGLDLGLCGDTLELLAAVLFGEEQKKNYSGFRISESNISGNNQQTNQVNYSPEVQAVTGVVKKNELTSLRILSINGLFYPIWLFWGIVMDRFTESEFTLIILVIFYGYFVAHLILALVKGKKYNLKATRVMAIIGIIIILFVLSIFVIFIPSLRLVFISFYESAFSIVTLVQLRKATPKNHKRFSR
jgi:cation transport ATPase